MSADVLQTLVASNQLTIDRLADLLNLQSHSIYPYLSHRELRYVQIRTLIRRSGDPAVARAFLNDLLSGLGWTVTHLPADLDLDGDGDVDTDDALRSAIAALDRLSRFLSVLHQGGQDVHLDEIEQLEILASQVCQGVASAKQIVGFLQDRPPRFRRRKARPLAGLSPRRNGSLSDGALHAGNGKVVRT